MHDIVTTHPRYEREVTARRARYQRARAAFNERNARLQAEHHAATARHRHAVREATLAGEKPPAPPPPPASPGDATALEHERQAIDQAERELLRELAPAIEAATRARADELLAEASELVTLLTELAGEVDTLRATVRAVRASGAAHRPTPRGRADAQALVAAVLQGEPLLDGEDRPRHLDLPQRWEREVLDDAGQVLDVLVADG